MWKTLWFWKLLLTYVVSMLMVTTLATSPLGIMDFFDIEPPASPANSQTPTLEEYYSGDGIKAAVYAIVTAFLLSVGLIGKDSKASEVLKAAIVDFYNRATIALAAFCTGIYWLSSALQANLLPYLQAFGTISLLILVTLTVYLIMIIIALHRTFVFLRWFDRRLREPAISLLRGIGGELRVAPYRAWDVLRRGSRSGYDKVLFILRWIKRKLRGGN